MPILTINGEQHEVASGTSYEKIAQEFQKQYPATIALVLQNGKMRELMRKVWNDAEVSFITTADEIGHNAYVRTAMMMVVKAVHDVAGEENARTKVEFSVGHGLYCTIYGRDKVSQDFLDLVEARMREMVVEEMPITKQMYPLGEAVEIFRKQGMQDKVKLFRYRRSSEINVYTLDGFCDYYYGYMMPNTSYIKYFRLEPYKQGFMLALPTMEQPTQVAEVETRDKFFDQMTLSNEWGHMLNIDTVGDLNSMICSGDVNQLILVQEALQERRIGEIARHIYEKPSVKFIMIAGPSSSGKTSFANRLSIQLRTYGLIPHLISLDNYFVNREDTPLDENGKPNFECLEAMDVKGFNDDCIRMLNGERVELPTFNFLTGHREMNGDYLQLGEHDVLVIEGIHGLNDEMSYELPADSKYKIYISALTCLNIDSHNRIPTTDCRLIRRIVRDARTRGNSAARTISMWPSVHYGEEHNIFPFQESADEMFNSAQIYELAVLKQYAEPLLFSIDKDQPEYYEAKRLLKFLDYFVGVDSKVLPRNSIIREFVGGSIFNV